MQTCHRLGMRCVVDACDEVPMTGNVQHLCACVRTRAVTGCPVAGAALR